MAGNQHHHLSSLSDMVRRLRECEDEFESKRPQPKQRSHCLSKRLVAKLALLQQLNGDTRELNHRQTKSKAADTRRRDTNNNRFCGSRRRQASVSSVSMEQNSAAALQSPSTSTGESPTQQEIRHSRMNSANENNENTDEQQQQQQQQQQQKDNCLCHKRRCQNCDSLCPCFEHFCPSCGNANRIFMAMRTVKGLKSVIESKRLQKRRQEVARHKRREHLMLNSSGRNECNHSVMVRVGGGFAPLVEYLKSHNKVVLSKHVRMGGTAFLCPWSPHYPGPSLRGRPRGIRYVDSVTQQLEEVIFANREPEKLRCECA